jgi:hypothetical protein
MPYNAHGSTVCQKSIIRDRRPSNYTGWIIFNETPLRINAVKGDTKFAWLIEAVRAEVA